MQNGSNSQCTSVEIIGGSAEPLTAKVEVVLRQNRRNSDRPWSVSCLSQLTSNPNNSRSENQVNNQGLANFSISESALHTLSPNNQPPTILRTSDSKNSLKKKRLRVRKRAGIRRGDSGSEGALCYDLPRLLNRTLVKSESFSGQSNLAQDLSVALSLLTLPNQILSSEMESEEENAMMRPNFSLGSYTTVMVPGNGASNLGSLAALANYNRDAKSEALLNVIGTEDANSYSEQAWDDFQEEKYNSENYSEGVDSDAARKLLEFGDDYRNYLDSQSDCCSSSLSAANNFDSLSPPRNRKFIPTPDSKSSMEADSSVMRRKKMMEYAEFEKKRRSWDGSRRRSSDGKFFFFGNFLKGN